MKDSWILNEIAEQRERLFLWAPVFFACGIGGYFLLLAEPPLWIGVPFVAGFAALAVLLRHRPGVFPFLILLFLVAAGFMTAQLRAHIIYTPMLHKKTGPVEVTGTIEAVETLEEGKGSRLLLYDLNIERLTPEQTPVKIRLTTRKGGDYAPGEKVQVLAQLNPPSPPVAPGAFDFQRYMYFQQIGAVGFIYKKMAALGQAGAAHQNYIERLRNIIAARMEKVISDKSQAMAIAFTTGQRTAISEEDNVAMRNSGLYHLISISGLHIGLFSALVFFVVRFLMACVPGMALKHPIKKYAAVFGFAAAAFYTALAGSSIPTQRTLIMVGMAYLAVILDRSPLSLRLVAFAALVVLLAAPESLISVSFQMSFAAIGALILFYDWARPWLIEWNRQGGFIRKTGLYLGGVCVTTIIATIATAPFSLFQFQNLALYGLIGNALAVPLTTFIIMPAIVLSLVLMPLHLEFIPLKVLDWGMGILLDIAHSVASLPHAVLHVPAWPVNALTVLMGGMIFFSLWSGRLRVLGLLPVLCAIVMVMEYRAPDILVADTFDLAGYTAPDGTLQVSGRRKNKFVIESWEKMAGLEKGEAKVWPREGRKDDMACDESACRLELKNHRIAFLKHPGALREECGWAEVIVTLGVLDRKPCDNAIIIDKFDGFRNGAHALWLEPKGIVIRTADEMRGTRPWSEGRKSTAK